MWNQPNKFNTYWKWPKHVSSEIARYLQLLSLKHVYLQIKPLRCNPTFFVFPRVISISCIYMREPLQIQFGPQKCTCLGKNYYLNYSVSSWASWRVTWHSCVIMVSGITSLHCLSTPKKGDGSNTNNNINR